MKGFLKRLVIGICTGLATGLLAVAVSAAGGSGQGAATETVSGSLPPSGPVRTDCNECHESVVDHWQQSAHGRATVDPIFQEAWQEKGSPAECLGCHTTNYDPETGIWEGEGIACSVCHGPQSAPHPETAMPTDPSSRLCGSCHLDTHTEWLESAHGEGELACVRCHNPHTTDLKISGMGDLCTNCHNEEGHFFDYTGHGKEGLTCTDCHLRVSDSPLGEGHGKRVHTFEVDLDICTECHGQEMHFPISGTDAADQEVMWSTYSPTDSEVCELESPVLEEEPVPPPTQPLNYLIVAAVGMGFGMAITPVAENWIRRTVSRD